MKYILKKEYPGSPKLGNIIDNLENDWIENYSEFWEEVVEKDYEILSFIVNQDFRALRKGEIVNKERPADRFRGYNISAGDTKGLLELSHWSIHSVKRISDGEI